MGLKNPLHLLILAGIVLLIFGPKRLPELGRSLGKGIRELRGSLGDAHEAGDADPRESARREPDKTQPPATP
jgi:sec-independent protein translocase protein TatA